VEKLIPTDSKDTRWTAVDPALNVQVIQTKNTSTYTTRAQPGIKYSPIQGFSKEEKTGIEKTSWEVVRRAMAGKDMDPIKRRVHVGKNRLRALIPIIEGIGVIASLLGSGPGLGLVAVVSFVGWRAIRYTRLDRIMYNVLSAGSEVLNTLDTLGDYMDGIMDAHEEGELEPYYIGFGLLLAFLFGARLWGTKKKSWWRDRTAHRPLDGTSDWGSNASSSPPASPRSPRLFGTDASGGETSDENEDLRMKTMRDRQTAIENSMSGLAQKLDILLEKMGAPAGQITATSIPATSHVSSPQHEKQ